MITTVSIFAPDVNRTLCMWSGDAKLRSFRGACLLIVMFVKKSKKHKIKPKPGNKAVCNINRSKAFINLMH